MLAARRRSARNSRRRSFSILSPRLVRRRLTNRHAAHSTIAVRITRNAMLYRARALLHGSVIWRRGVDGIEGRLTPDPGQSAVPFKANRDCRHHIPKQRHRVTNWAAYDSALRQRGSLTVWFTEAAIAAWKAEPRATRGGQPRYSALAITTALTLRAVFRLALRQTEGLIASLLRLLG